MVSITKIRDREIAHYRLHLLREEKSLATIEKYLRDVAAFVRWLGGREVSREVVLQYKAELVQKYAVASVNSMLSAVNSFLEFCECCEMKVKCLKVQRDVFRRADRELSRAEYKRLLRAAKQQRNEQILLIMQTICATGIRVSELSYITAEAVKSGVVQVRLKGKVRTVLLGGALCRLLLGYMRRQGIDQGSVFVTRSGRPVDRFAVWKAMKALCVVAGVARSKVFPHNLRHLFARLYYAQEKDIVRLADILGHSSVNTTRIYTMESGETHRRQIERLGLVYLRV